MEKSVNFGKIVISNLYTSKYQKKGTITCELKQVVTTTTTYPSAGIGLGDNLFDSSEFSELESPSYENKETRVFWMNVPAGTTSQDVQLRLDKAVNAKLVKILSNRPILNSNQENAISSGLTTLEKIAESQVVKDKDGKMISRNGEPCFKKIVFAIKGAEDENILHDNAYKFETANVDSDFFSDDTSGDLPF